MLQTLTSAIMTTPILVATTDGTQSQKHISKRWLKCCRYVFGLEPGFNYILSLSVCRRSFEWTHTWLGIRGERVNTWPGLAHLEIYIDPFTTSPLLLSLQAQHKSHWFAKILWGCKSPDSHPKYAWPARGSLSPEHQYFSQPLANHMSNYWNLQRTTDQKSKKFISIATIYLSDNITVTAPSA